MTSSLEWWRWLLLLVFSGGLLGVWFWAQRGRLRFGELLRASPRRLRVRETRWIAARACIVLVEIEGQAFLLAQNPGGLAWQKVGPPSVSPTDKDCP